MAHSLTASEPTGTDLSPAIVDALPVAVLVLDPADSRVTHANRRAREHGATPGAHPLATTRTEPPADLTRRDSVPLRLGDVDMTMTVIVLPDEQGIMLVEQPRHTSETARLLQMIDGMPVAVLTADPDDDFRITYLNDLSRTILRRLGPHLPVPVDDLIGTSIDLFHADPTHQRALLSDPARLPFTTRLRLGNDTVALEATAITAPDGRYLGPMLTLKLITEEVRLSADVATMADALAASFTQLDAHAAELRGRAQAKATVVGELAGAAERMNAAFDVISRQLTNANGLAAQIDSQAQATHRAVRSLEENADRIERLSASIARIAAQTNLLALNAGIEAARAGKAGRGFAVVADEVKSLATQTARTNAEMSAQIVDMRSATAAGAQAMRAIATEIAELVSTASEVRRVNDEQAANARAVDRSMAMLRQAAADTDSAADRVGGLAAGLGERAQGLRRRLAAALR